MPVFLSSLVAALLSGSREQARVNDKQDLFRIGFQSVGERRADDEGTPDGSAAGRRSQPPAARLAVAFSLFLLGRSTRRAPGARREQTAPRLPVKIDLRDSEGVVATDASDATTTEVMSSSSSSDEGSGGGDVAQNGSRDSSADLVERNGVHGHLALASDLRAVSRHITIVTTAAMPWMTGTSVNPALRAIYLAKDGHHVTLLVPWLATVEEQRKLFSHGSPVFSSRADQAQHIQQWAQGHVSDVHIDVRFYEGVYAKDLGSILPVGAITDVFDDDSLVKDVCILEEPEHLTWHHAGRVWTEIFPFVVGIIHTNYIEYARNYGFFGPHRALALLFLNMWVCRGYCHRIIKLSDAVQEFPNSITSNVHGVRDMFIGIGRDREGTFPRGAYFMGKVVWAKGYRDLIDNMIRHYRDKGTALPIDFYGAGADVDEVRATIAGEPALSRVSFDARVVNHAGEWLQGYKVFVNASRSDVVCTATAEALAMGKMVVCLQHPSNEFFATFANCITYRTPAQFSQAVEDALKREPEPLSEKDAYRLSWEAATERLYDAMRLPLYKRHANKIDIALGSAHATLSKIYPQPGKGIRRAMAKAKKSSSDLQRNSLERTELS